MMKQEITTIDGGSTEYWRERRLGFRLIREADRAQRDLAAAPMYLHGGYDADGDVIAVENLEPHDAMDDAIRAIEANDTALAILAAQGRTRIGDHQIRQAIHGSEPDEWQVEDPHSNPLWGPDTD